MSIQTQEDARPSVRPSAMGTYLALVKALWLSWTRDKAQVFFNLLLPLMFLLLLTMVYGGGGDAVPRVLEVGDVAVLEGVDADHLEVETVSGLDGALEQVEEGDADAAVVQDGDEVTVYYSQTTGVTGDLAEARLGELIADANVTALTAEGEAAPVRSEDVAAEDRSMAPVQYLAPGMLAWGIAISGVFGAAGTIVDLKRDKLIRRLRITPASAGRFIAARISVSLLVVLLQTVLFLGVAAGLLGLHLSAWTWFAVPLVLLGTFSFLAMGVIIGTIAKTSPGAAGLSNLVTMPMAFVSGAFYSVQALPGWMQWISQLSPMTHLNLAIQATVALGEPPSMVLGHIAYLIGFALVIGLIAWKTFKFDEL
ncbi:MAG TPA: ABC transporter permease [Glycomyces sp.]|nr:ABC transporter permease [Glycomyces sp.]